MTLNLTQFYVEIAGQYTDGELRVYRQHVAVLGQGEVAGNTFCESVSDTLNFTSNFSPKLVFSQVIADDLGLTDTAAFVPFPARCADTLNFVQTVGLVRDFSAAFTDTLTLTQTAQKAVPASANDTLNLTDNGPGTWHFLSVEDRKIVYNTLNFQQTLFSLSSLEVYNTLNFQQTVVSRNSTIREDLFQHIFFYHYTPTTHRKWIDDTLNLTSRVNIPRTLTVNNTLNLSDVGSMTNPYNTLNFVQTVAAGKTYWFSHTLNFVETLNVQGVFTRTISDDLGIGHAFTGYILSDCVTKQYSPFQGASTVTTDVLDDDLPYTQSPNLSDRFLLYYPARGHRTINVVLRAPELDNRDRNAYTRVIRETRGGTMHLYRDPNWPKVRTIVMTFIGLSKQNIDDIQSLFQNTLGQEVGITDWEGRQWAGVIVNPEEPATENSKGNWSISFSLEGNLLDGQYPGADDGSSLNLTQTVTAVIA